VAGISTVGVGATWVRLRAHLADGSFIEAFYNQATDKTAFAAAPDVSIVCQANPTARLIV